MPKNVKIYYLCYYKPFPTNSKELKAIFFNLGELGKFFKTFDVGSYVVDKVYLNSKNVVIKIEEKINWELE